MKLTEYASLRFRWPDVMRILGRMREKPWPDGARILGRML
jgi:hypothetical protein